MRYLLSIVVTFALVLTACEGQLDCERCGEEHLTSDHVTSVEPQPDSTAVDPPPMVDDILLDFVANRRSAGFEKVNRNPYPSEVSASRINVFVSSFGIAEYLETRPDAPSSSGMLPRGAFVVREILDEKGEVTKLTALYRGPEGYNPQSGDFWFAVTDPGGEPLAREDGSQMAGALTSCSSCHAGRASADYLFGVPDDFRDPAFYHPDASEEASEEMPEDSAVDAEEDEGPSETISFSGFQLSNEEADLSRPQQSEIPAFSAAPGTVVVVARDASRAEFEAVWGPLEPDVVYVDMSGTGSFGAPIINGGETWALRDAAGGLLGPQTPVGEAGLAYALVEGAWGSLAPEMATPGRSTYAGGATRITEWSDAGDYHHEFVEFVIGQ